MNFLCDTNVLSEAFKRKPNPRAIHWLEGREKLFLSVVTLEEISFGLYALSSLAKLAAFESLVRSRCVVIPISESIALRAGRLRGVLRNRGIQRAQADMFIAATAQEDDLTLVTRNTRDFEDCGIALFDPFAL